MTEERFRFLMTNDNELLTKEEVVEGWHFCCEMDGLLLNRNDPDNDFCHCLEENLHDNDISNTQTNTSI